MRPVNSDSCSLYCSMTPDEKMNVWQALVSEYHELLDALVFHPRWEEALLVTPELEAVVVQGRDATDVAFDCYELYLNEGLAAEDEEKLDLVPFETQERVHEVWTLLAQLDGEVGKRPVRQVN